MVRLEKKGITLVNPMQYKGSITVSSDFPTSVEVKSGWFYTILADVTDNDGSKTNTGQSFFAGDEIAWNGSDWTAFGNENVYVPYSGATSNVDLGVYSLTADALTLGTGTALTAGTFTDNTTLSFKANYNSGDDAFRMQFYESGTAESPTTGGYIQYNSDSNYLEYGGITTLGVDVPGFRIARDDAKTTFLGDAEFQGDVDLWKSTQIGRYNDIAHLTIAGQTNVANSARLNIWEQANLGGFIRYDGDTNDFFIGTNGTATDTDAIKIDRGSTSVNFLGAITVDSSIESVGSILTDSYLQSVGTANRIKLGYDSSTLGYTYADSDGDWHHKPYTGWNYFDTPSVNNYFFLYDYTQPTSSYSGIGGNAWAITYQTDTTVTIRANGDSWLTGGNLGIGTKTPDEALEVVGNVLAKEVISANSGTITRVGGVITSVAITDGRTLTPTRTSGLITSITDGTRTWTFTYTDGLITSWSVT